MADRKEKNIELSIITINYQTDKLILDLLDELKPHTGVEVIVVDNSPTDSLRTKLPKRKDLTYLFANENLGFSGGNNLGLASAKGEWVFLLNSDTLASTRDILRLLAVTQKKKLKVSAPQLIQLDGKIQNNVGYFDSFSQNPANYIFVRPRFVNCSQIDSPVVADLATGAALLIHRSVIERIGSLDAKRFFMYFEDLDFSYRLHRAGIKVLYYPDVKIIHFGGASSDQDTRQKNKNYQQGLNTYLKKHRGFLINWLNNKLHFLT